MPRSVAELLPSIPVATTSQTGLATPAQIATLEVLDTDDAGATFNPLAINLAATRAYDDYLQSGAIQLALAAVTHVAGATATVRVTGNGAAVTVDGVTVFWADGEPGAKSWSDQRTLALWFHPGLNAALAIVPGDGGGGGGGSMTASQILAALLTVDGTGSALDADLVDGQHASALLARANHTGTQAISTVSGLQTALDAKAPSANPVFTGTITIPDGALAIADTSGLQTALDARLQTDIFIASDANVTVTVPGQRSGVLFNQTLTLTANRTVDIALSAGFGRIYTIWNQAAGGFTVAVRNENPSSPGSYLNATTPLVTSQVAIVAIRGDGFAEIIYQGPQITAIEAQVIQTATLSAGAVTCNLSLGSKFAVTINGAWNAGNPLLGTNLPTVGQARTIELVATISGTQTIDLSGLPWLGGTPTLVTSAGSVLVLVATWEGSTLVDVTGANRA